MKPGCSASKRIPIIPISGGCLFHFYINFGNKAPSPGSTHPFGALDSFCARRWCHRACFYPECARETLGISGLLHNCLFFCIVQCLERELLKERRRDGHIARELPPVVMMRPGFPTLRTTLRQEFH
jgi:hypothetical protein